MLSLLMMGASIPSRNVWVRVWDRQGPPPVDQLRWTAQKIQSSSYNYAPVIPLIYKPHRLNAVFVCPPISSCLLSGEGAHQTDHAMSNTIATVTGVDSEPPRRLSTSLRSPAGNIPYWNVNVAPARWTVECPSFLQNQPEKNIGILSTPDERYQRQGWEFVRQIVGMWKWSPQTPISWL